jgi:hypothetical protein
MERRNASFLRACAFVYERMRLKNQQNITSLCAGAYRSARQRSMSPPLNFLTEAIKRRSRALNKINNRDVR